MTEETLFDLPTDPDGFGLILSPSSLRRINFSGLDYDTARRAVLEYIKTYFPDDFNDFVASNGIMMLVEILSSITAKLSLRSDILANEGTLPTAQTEEAVVNHIALINQRIRRQTPAIVDVECTVERQLFTELRIPAGTKFTVAGPDNTQVYYEIYRAPNDWTSDIIIPAGKRGVIAWGIEGQFAAPAIEVSGGGPNQLYEIIDSSILELPLTATVTVGSTVEDWTVITEPLERHGPNDKVVEVNFVGSKAIFRFGDDVTGQAPLAGSSIAFTYRVGGGRRGRIGIGQIDLTRQLVPEPPANASTNVHFRNITPSSGGVDKETLAQAKRRAPREFAMQGSIVTSADYAQAASTFSHPAFGAVSKAVATTRTSLNANLVELYVLAEGPDGELVTPNAGLKSGLVTFFSDLNVLTDHVVVLDGAIKSVDIKMNVIVDRNADASVVKVRVEKTIDDYFDITNWDMGEPFYISNFIEELEQIDGVSYINLTEPHDDILPTNLLAEEGSAGIGLNEIVVLGDRASAYYYSNRAQQ